MWDVLSGVCERVIDGHLGLFRSAALAVCGARLVGGFPDGAVMVWAMEPEAPWALERTLRASAPGAVGLAPVALAVWRGKVISGSADRVIRVWDAGTGARDAALVGHAGDVRALAVDGDRLFSASEDGTLREWALGPGAWASVRKVEVFRRPWTTIRCLRCLAVCGSKLLGGTGRSLDLSSDDGCDGELRVWDLAGLGLEHALPQPAGAAVGALLAVEGEVWAGVGRTVVAWRRL